MFRCRGAQYVDVLILFDWNTSSKTLTSDNPLNVLRKILEYWDPGISYKKITILDGGYAEWITRYPQFTSNPKVALDTASNNVSNEMLDNIEYPEWIHSDDEDNMKSHESKTNNSKSVNQKKNVSKVTILSDKLLFKSGDSELSNNISLPVHSNNLTNTSLEATRIPKANTTLRPYDSSLLKLQHKRASSIMKKNDTPLKPTVDRSNKPVSIDTSDANLVLKLMRQLNELAKCKQALEQEILEQEHALYMQQGVTYKGSNEEDYIHGNLKSLCLKLEEKVRHILNQG